MHVCPMVTPGLPPVPHVGGPILPPCQPTVLTCTMPQARISDMATCVGPPDVIAKGAATVLVGGLPAARMTDTMAHGGAIIVGCFTVLIGGAAFVARPISRSFNFSTLSWDMNYGPNISIQGDPSDPAFQSKALAALIRLDTTPTGHAMMDAIEGSGNDVTIIPYVPPAGWGPYNAYCQPANGTNAGTPGVGSDSTVAWDPSVNSLGGAPGTVPASSEPGADIILGHEMIHATHNATGTQGGGPQNPDNVNVSEERNTVGLPAQTYTDPARPAGPPPTGTALPDTTGGPYTENGLRDDYRGRGIPVPTTGNPPPPRPSYYPPNAAGGPGTPF